MYFQPSIENKAEWRRTWGLPDDAQPLAVPVTKRESWQNHIGSANPTRVVQLAFQVWVCPTFLKDPRELNNCLFQSWQKYCRSHLSLHLISEHNFPLWGNDANPTCPAFSREIKSDNKECYETFPIIQPCEHTTGIIQHPNDDSVTRIEIKLREGQHLTLSDSSSGRAMFWTDLKPPIYSTPNVICRKQPLVKYNRNIPMLAPPLQL